MDDWLLLRIQDKCVIQRLSPCNEGKKCRCWTMIFLGVRGGHLFAEMLPLRKQSTVGLADHGEGGSVFLPSWYFYLWREALLEAVIALQGRFYLQPPKVSGHLRSAFMVWITSMFSFSLV